MLVILPLLSLANLLVMPNNRIEWLVIVLQTVALFILNRRVGRWYWIGYYMRHLSIALLCLVIIYSYLHLPRNSGDTSLILLFGNGLLLAIWLFYLVWAFVSSKPTCSPYNLVFPLKGKRYYTNEGGSSRLINNHNPNQAQRYALDFYQLNAIGMRCNGFYPEILECYTIFGKKLFAPAAGKVLKVVDGLEDNTPPDFDTGNRRAGNHILFKTDDDKYIVMAHFKKNSILVKEGQRLEVGTSLGQVGNSGRSEEPHLHIHCMDTLEQDYVLCGEGIPIQFDNEFLVRNQLVSHPQT